MKVSKVQNRGSKAQSRTTKSRQFSNFGRRALDIGLQPSRLGDRDGIALVITLIMLAIITFMAVTFLVLSTRERASVSTAMDQKIARDASDTAFSRVSAELLSRMILHTNFQDFDLLVSTNYYNANGLNNTFPAPLNPTNVNYDYVNGPGHNPLNNAQEAEINIASLLYNPRPPVYVITNAGTGQSDFRFYLDLNRNGRFDTNGTWPVITSDPTHPYYNATNGQMVLANFSGPIASNYFVGDPEWIGVLSRPWELHSADNQFISRYAYLVIPAGKTLDVNTMHNQAFTKATPRIPKDGFMRNQGVGPWELNLAAFLTDLNTNIWYGPQSGTYNPPNPYFYGRPFGNPNTGLGFEDAYSLLCYRYNNDYTSLIPAGRLFSTPATLVFDNIDEYSDGPIMTTTTNIPEAPPDLTGANWVGAENTNHYFSMQDLFDRNKTSYGTLTAPGFAGRLQQAGTSNDSYNAYTFYRMLAQLGTDSQPDTTRLNINYKNTDDSGNIVPGMETNHIPWKPEDFFTNAANRILATFTNDMGVALSTHYIPLYPTNYYTPAVHRALQLAANIFDATTNQTVPLTVQTNAFFPSVFRPIFTVQNGQVYISDFKEATDAQQVFGFTYMDFNSASNSPGVHGNWIIYGVPWVVGAKKGFPNFNQFAFQTTYAFTRKLWFQRINSSGDLSKDYQMKQEYVMDITNQVGMNAWNSYQSQWPMNARHLRLFGTNIFTLRILNDTNPSPPSIDLINPATVPAGIDFHPAAWFGYNAKDPSTMNPASSRSSVQMLISATNLMMNGNIVTYDPNVPGFRLGEHFNPPVVRPIPQLYMYTTNRIVYALIDESVTPNRVVDFVNLDDSGKYVDFTGILEAQAKAASVGQQPYQPEVIWRTNAVNGPVLQQAISDGLNYQIAISVGAAQVNGWIAAKDDPGNNTTRGSFRQWLMDETAPVGDTNGAPYTPTYIVTNQVSWEANDPLVHYTIPDLTDPQPAANKWGWNPGSLTHRYSPWNYQASGAPADDKNGLPSVAKKDPVAIVSRDGNNAGNSDAWDFPTNKFWNIGILGRVHRGTPWQTVYMKSPIIGLKDWQNWSGNLINVRNPLNNRVFADGALTMPNTDYQLFDLFTTSPNPSASLGQLNINQTNLAAWSAALTGVNVITNGNGFGSTYIPPAGVYDPANPTPVAKIWRGILNARNNNNTNALIFPNHTFQHVGDVLAAPELTVSSPYVPPQGPQTTANDEVYERIPQQIMSLLTLNQSPRFVIYSFGQTLHPAANHPLVTGGTFNGLCTNYQITAESATRAVVHVEGTTDPKYVNGKVDSLGRSYPPHLVVEQFNVLSPD